MILQLKNGSSLYPATNGSVSSKVALAVTHLGEMLPSVANVWNRHHSDAQWNLLALDEYTETRNLCQLAAEIKAKRDALTEAHFTYEKNLLKAKMHEKAAEKLDGLDAEMEFLEATHERAHAQMAHEAVIGATKDIAILRSTYDKIMTRIIEKHGKFDELVFELEEKEYWIKRIIVQSLQDVRQFGRITVGNQRELEHLGIEPIEVGCDIDRFFSETQKRIVDGVPCTRNFRDHWLEGLVERYMPRVEERLSRMGQSTEHLFLQQNGTQSPSDTP